MAESAFQRALRIADECLFLSPFEAAMQHMGQCEIHELLYVEVDPTDKKGCPRCNEQDKGSGSSSDV